VTFGGCFAHGLTVCRHDPADLGASFNNLGFEQRVTGTKKRSRRTIFPSPFEVARRLNAWLPTQFSKSETAVGKGRLRISPILVANGKSDSDTDRLRAATLRGRKPCQFRGGIWGHPFFQPCHNRVWLPETTASLVQMNQINLFARSRYRASHQAFSSG